MYLDIPHYQPNFRFRELVVNSNRHDVVQKSKEKDSDYVLHICGSYPKGICKLLKKLAMIERFVFRTGRGTVKQLKWKEGHEKSVRTLALNPLRHQK